MTLITWKAKKKKADVEVKSDEIKALHDAIELVYQPLIHQQKDRIQELEVEVKSLREQLNKEREDRQKEISMMTNHIANIASALGMRALTQLRDEKGRFIKAECADVE